MELGVVEAARLRAVNVAENGKTPRQEVQSASVSEMTSTSLPLSITAEELLRELVEEHKDASFEYKSSTGLVRNGRWVGGDSPIEDPKTKQRFKMLALFCQQVSSQPFFPVLCSKINCCFYCC